MEKRNGLNRLAAVKSGETTILEAFGPPNAITAGADSLAGALYAISEVLTRGLESDSMRGFLGGEFGYGVDYENDVFLLHPDYEDDECKCGFRERSDKWDDANPHSATCPDVAYYAWLNKWEHILRAEHVPLEKKRDAEKSYCMRLFGHEHPVCNCGQDERRRQWYTENDHDFRCPIVLPNFWHKPSGLKITWYKWIGRDMKADPELSGERLAEILTECWNSIPAEAREKAATEHEEEHTPEAEEEKQEVSAAMFSSIIHFTKVTGSLHD